MDVVRCMFSYTTLINLGGEKLVNCIAVLQFFVFLLLLKVLLEVSYFVLVLSLVLPFIIPFSEIVSFSLVVYTGIFEVVDVVFGCVFRIHILSGRRGKHAVFILHLVLYIYFLKTYDEWQKLDGVLAICTFMTAQVVLVAVRDMYWAHFCQLMWSLRDAIDTYGWKRNVIYCVSVVSAAFLITNMVSSAYSMSWSTLREGVLGRLENSVLQVEEKRTIYSETMIHPVTQGKSDPRLFNKLYRYIMEDVTMTCDIRYVYLSDGFPASDYVSWRHNGVPIELTDRHRHNLSFKEISKTQSEFHRLLSERAISEYEINATLTITLLQLKEFGSYTCHVKKCLSLTLPDLIKNVAKFENYNANTNQKNDSSDRPRGSSAHDRDRSSTSSGRPHQDAQLATENVAQLLGEESKKRSEEAKDKAVDMQRLFQDIYTWKDEFRLIRLTDTNDVVRAPPGSMLTFTHSYWHVSSQDLMVDVDYTVNGKSFFELCPGMFHGCSKLMMLYWFWGHETGLKFGLPPLQLFTVWGDIQPAMLSNRFHLIHCLCENAYGLHQVHYIRRYFNKTSGREESVEILHPHSLLVVPREKNMLNVFDDRSECVPFVDRSPCEQVPPVCLRGWDIRFIKEFARMAVTYFGWMETGFFAIAIIVGFLLVRNASWLLGSLGRHIKHRTLHGSMGFYWSAVEACPVIDPPQLCNDIERYDLYLSYSVAEDDQKKVHEDVLPCLEERRKLKVLARNRGNDVPANHPEIEGISNAIERSKRVVLFLSEHYLKDTFLADIEAPAVVECFCDRDKGRGPEDVLIVKLGTCDTPLWASRFEVHNWTSSTLTIQDYMLNLIRWLEPSQQRSTFRSFLDFRITCLPLATIAFISLVSYFLIG